MGTSLANAITSPGAAVALRRAALAEVGLLDPAFFPIYFEETDLQARLRKAGWGKIWYEPAAWLIHFESQTQGVGSPRFVYRYTKNRIRYLALQGFAQGWRRAIPWEVRWIVRHARDGRLLPALRAYAVGLWHWPSWRSDRHRRSTVPRL